MAADRHAEAAPAALPGWAREITRLTALTGAGISTDSGIPDFPQIADHILAASRA